MAGTESAKSAAHASPSPSCVAYGGKSWAEDIQKYHAAKSTLPWQPEQLTPVKLITRFEKSREERQYDLVLGKFRDAEKELKQQENDSSMRKQELENSRARQLRTVQRFNLINHSPLYTGARDAKDPPNDPRGPRRTSNVDYNIVTNAPSHGLASSVASPTSAPVSKSRCTQEFNILTNKYHDRHEQRERDELLQSKQLAAVKFTKKNTFDPVRTAFYDPEKETLFCDTRSEEQRAHGLDRAARLPPREQFAEGKIYNIVNQRVLNAGQITRYNGHAARAKNKMVQHTFEQRMTANGQQVAERDELLRLNRFAHERHAQAFVHGFDPITNQPFDGIHAKPRLPTRTHEALPAWQVLEQGVPSTSKVAVAMAKRATERVTSTESASAVGGAEWRSNILVVDHPTIVGATTPMKPSSTSATTANSPAVRTGGFQHH